MQTTLSPREDLRDLFHVPAGAYFSSHSVGPLPRVTRVAMAQYADSWAHRAGDCWPEWEGHLEGYCESVALLLGSKPEEVCPQVNVSSALSKVLGSFGGRKKTVAYFDFDFPSTSFMIQSAQAFALEAKCVDTSHYTDLTQAVLEACEQKPDLLFFSHVTFGNSTQIDAVRVCKRARELGVVTIVDVAQSAGVIPVDVRAWQADIVIGCCVKWLCGGPGASFLWVDPNLCEQMKPVDIGWHSHESPFEFDASSFRYAQGAQRFFGGTPSVLPFVAAQKSLEQILSIGVKNIRKINLSIGNEIAVLAKAHQIQIKTPLGENQRGGTITLMPRDKERLKKALQEQGVSADYRETHGFRFSPHVTNTPEDLTCLKKCFET